MSTYKRVNGDYTIQTLGANTITFAGNVANAVTVVVDGNFTVTGNATLTGNISGDKLFNGTTSIEIPAANGNANITIGGVSNVAVFTTTGVNVSGVTSVSGNIVGGNINTAGVVSATGNVNGGNINTAGNVVITRDASVTQPTIRFQDTDTTGTAGTILGAVEWFTSDVTAPGVSASIQATLVDTGGNSNVQILTGTPGSLAARVTVLHTGEVGIANAAPNTTFGVTGTAYISGNTTVLANVAAGNISTGGLVTATGNITGGNINTAGLATVTGNVTGGNLITAGSISAGAAGITATGNVRGGNVVSDAVITATGNIASGASISAQDQITTQGNVIANNISAGNIINTGILNATSNVSAAGNVTGSNLVTGGSVTAVGAVTGGSINTAGLITAVGNITTSAFFVGDGGFLSNVTAISNVTTSQITNGTTVMAITGPNGNIFATVNAVGNILVLSDTGAFVTGTLSATGNVTGGNVNTAGIVSATGNINGGNVNAGIGNFTTILGAANANALTSGTVSSDRLSGSYVINVTGNVSGTAATVTNAAQANITSLGTLTSLAVTGNVTGGNLVTGGAVSATGAVTGAAITGTSLTVSTGNVTAGNLILSGAIVDSAQLDIQTTALNANIVLTPNGTGNVNIGRMSASGNITSAAFYGPLVGAVSSATTVSATGNITGGNINTAGQVTATGNITGGNINLVSGTITLANSSIIKDTAGNAVAIGKSAGTTSQAASAVAIGYGAGSTTQGSAAIAIGLNAGASTQGINGIALGEQAAFSDQLSDAIAIGRNAGYLDQGSAAIAIGVNAGQTSQANNSIIINASGSALNQTVANTFTVAPVRNDVSNIGQILFYNTSSKEVTYGNTISISGNITSGNLITSGTTGLVSVNSITHTGTNAVGNIGSASSYFNQVFATATTALYADLAEKYTADQFYLPGTVVSFGGTAEVTASTTVNDRRIAGVVSAKPSYLMNAGLEAEHTAVVALQGRVPCLVQGPVAKGDMMVSAGNGRAQACDNPLTGAVIGKALENFDGVQGTIEVVVGRI